VTSLPSRPFKPKVSSQSLNAAAARDGVELPNNWSSLNGSEKAQWLTEHKVTSEQIVAIAGENGLSALQQAGYQAPTTQAAAARDGVELPNNWSSLNGSEKAQWLTEHKVTPEQIVAIAGENGLSALKQAGYQAPTQENSSADVAYFKQDEPNDWSSASDGGAQADNGGKSEVFRSDEGNVAQDDPNDWSSASDGGAQAVKGTETEVFVSGGGMRGETEDFESNHSLSDSSPEEDEQRMAKALDDDNSNSSDPTDWSGDGGSNF